MKTRYFSASTFAVVAAFIAATGYAESHIAANSSAEQSMHQTVDGTAQHNTSDVSLARGRYLVKIAGCNDCHTPGYNERAGRMPEADWLTGVPVGFRGPWGTSYPSNLRHTVQALNEEEWLGFARRPRLPPMPWFSLEAMSDQDLRDIYRFIYSLGPKGVPAPAALPPGEESARAFIPFAALPAGKESATPFIPFVAQTTPAKTPK